MADETAPLGLALDATGDIEILTATPTDGLRFASGLEAVTNNIESILNLVRGEWFVDVNLGVPYYQDIHGQKYDEAHVLSIFREAVFQEPRVTNIIKLSAEYNTQTRLLTIYFELMTSFGTVTTTVEL